MNDKIAGFSYIYNGNKFDIPFIESIKSVIDVVDQFVLTECYSEDDTWKTCLQLQKEYPDKVKLLRREWVNHFTEISNLANWTSLFIDIDINYIFQLQSDEVFHEKDLEKLKSLPSQMERENKVAARWKYIHFLGSPSLVFPFIYSTLVRVVKRRQGWNVIGDGVQFATNEQIIKDQVLNTDIEVFHYGKMKSPKAGYTKEVSFQNLYTDIGFPDPKMKQMKDQLGEDFCDYLYLFESNIKEGKVKEFTGTHPKFMVDRIKLFKDNGWEQFVSIMKEGLKID